jgi:hypothetical protein
MILPPYKSEYRRQNSEQEISFVSSDPCLLNPALFVHLNRHVRADSPAERAARALVGFFEDYKVVTFFIEFFREPDGLLRAHFNAELAAFASVLINHNLGHYFFPVVLILSSGLFEIAGATLGGCPFCRRP